VILLSISSWGRTAPTPTGANLSSLGDFYLHWGAGVKR
jgi:hypothetical protein